MIGWPVDPMLLHWPGYVTRIYYVTLMTFPTPLDEWSRKRKHLQRTDKLQIMEFPLAIVYLWGRERMIRMKEQNGTCRPSLVMLPSEAPTKNFIKKVEISASSATLQSYNLARHCQLRMVHDNCQGTRSIDNCKYFLTPSAV